MSRGFVGFLGGLKEGLQRVHGSYSRLQRVQEVLLKGFWRLMKAYRTLYLAYRDRGFQRAYKVFIAVYKGLQRVHSLCRRFLRAERVF